MAAEVACPTFSANERVLRKVARRKVPALQKAMRVSQADLRTLVDSGSLTESSLEALLKLKERERMALLVDVLQLETEENRQKFLDLVASRSPWLQEEMVVEMQAENGSLEVDEAEVEDASFIVHRHFGTSRRFSEMDKKTMTSLVATKAQVTKEVWGRRLEAAKKELETLRAEITEREKLLGSTNDTLKTFVKRNEMGLYDFTDDTRSTTESLISSKPLKGEDAIINDIIRRTNFILKKFAKILLDRQTLTEQKKECMTILKTDDQRVPVHTLIRDAIRHLSAENQTSREQLKVMKRKVVDLEEQLNARDAHVEQLQAEVNALKQHIPQLMRTKTPTHEQLAKAISSPPRGLSRLGDSSSSNSRLSSAVGSNRDVVDGNLAAMPLVALPAVQPSAFTSRPGTAGRALATSTPINRQDSARSTRIPQTELTRPVSRTAAHELTRQVSNSSGLGGNSSDQLPTPKATTSNKLVPLQKSTRSRTAGMWPNARDGRAKTCLFDV